MQAALDARRPGPTAHMSEVPSSSRTMRMAAPHSHVPLISKAKSVRGDVYANDVHAHSALPGAFKRTLPG